MSSTESQNPNTKNLDKLSTQEFVSTYIDEDKAVWVALEKASGSIAKAIDIIYSQFKTIKDQLEPYDPTKPELYNGPRLFYIGAGTSGRLGVLDASECLPTFSSHPDMVQGIIAGGDRAIRHPVEGAEDDEAAGYKIISKTLNSHDTLIAISASGSAPYVIGALKAAKDKGSRTIAMANNTDALSFKYAEHSIFLDTGAEILAGSTRLKAGTAQKITLNIISTGLMVKLGKVMGNLMVDVQATNAKLKKRAIGLVKQLTNCSEAEAVQALEECQYRVKKAVERVKRGK